MPYDSNTYNPALSTALTMAQLVDAIGDADALAKAATKRVDQLKAELKAALGPELEAALKANDTKEVVGDRFAISFTQYLRETADTKALKEHFGEEWGRWTNVACVQTTSIKVVATAALARAA